MNFRLYTDIILKVYSTWLGLRDPSCNKTSTVLCFFYCRFCDRDERNTCLPNASEQCIPIHFSREYTPAGFRVKLHQTIDLSDDWEVGLYLITYPRITYNLQDGDNHIYYSDDGYIFYRFC